ncbi:MAG: M23 family metallopeptidase [Candidatus Cloacimonetes bacterium]|nr:M23 family metallopeptidase [Candidatus Cloacimonadota bacterium]
MGIKSIEDTNFRLKVSLKRNVLIAVSVALLLLVLFMVSGIIYIHNGYRDMDKTYLVMEENSHLKDKITHLNSEIDSIMIRLELMENWEDDIRSRENFKEINKEVREMGIGGLPQIDNELRLSDPKANLEYNLLVNRINHLRSKVAFNYQTHEELHGNYQLRSDLYRSTPSIYPTFGRISSAYGKRKHPISGKKDFHYGVDLANKKGTPVYATASGKVTVTSRTAKMGRYIKISHDFGFETVYGHLDRIQVKKGQEVEKGQIIGRMGNTGDSTGPHLHYEVHRYNRYRNPAKYFIQEREDIALTK